MAKKSQHTTEVMGVVERGRDTGAPPFTRSPKLVCVVGDDAGQVFPLTQGRTLIGRSRDADLCLTGDEISREHAEIVRSRDDYVLRDLQSRNGTAINGVVVQEQLLRPGDRIDLGGGTILVFAIHDELVQQALRLQKLEHLAGVTGGIVHDFKNTLGVIQSNAELLLAAVPASGEARAMVEDIMTAARSGLDSARRLLYFAGREGGAARTEVPVAELVEGVLVLVRRIFKSNQIEIRVKIDPTCGVRGDRDELHHAVLNLVVNARDAMPEGGTLTVSAVGHSFTRAEATLHHLPCAGEYVELVVADTGLGMDESTQGHAFEPFFTTKAAGSGTGMGLPTVYGIVRNHGGNVLLDSRLGQGTRMRLFLPRAAIGA